MNDYTFVDAQEMGKLHPDSFYAPSKDDLAKIKAGDFVKVSIAGERFWVKVTKVELPHIIGEVDNQLLNSYQHGYSLGSKIVFKPENVFDIMELT